MKGVIRFCNPAAYNEGGYSEKDFIGKHFSEVITLHRGDLAKYYKLFRSTMKGEEPQKFEFNYIRRDGTPGCAEIYVSLIHAEGKKTGVTVHKIDITERKKMEKLLLESEEKFSKAFRSSPNIFTISRLKDGIMLDVNDSFTHITGYTREEVIGHSAIDLDLWAEKGTRDRIVQILQKQGRVTNEECDFRMKSGEICTALVSAELSNIGGEPCIIFISVDVTEHKRAEELMRESEEKYRDLLDNTNDLIQSVTPDGRFRYVNYAWRKALSYSESEISNLRLSDIIHPDYLQHCQLVFKKIMSGEDVGRINTAFISKNGSRIIVEGDVNCKFVDGKPVYTRAIFRDITENKYLEERVLHLSSAVAMSTDCIVITDFNAKIIDVNNKILGIYGADSKDELIGKHFLELIVPAERAMVNMDVTEIVEKGYLECREYHIISKHGHTVPMQMSSSLVRDVDGNPVGMVRMARELNKRN